MYMPDDFPITSSTFPIDFDIYDEYPEELYEWDDFMKYFPVMQGNYSMHPIFWKLYAYTVEKIKEHN